MEANKVTIFLFLILVVVMAFSGFLIYDGLTSMPAPPAQPVGVNYGLRVINPMDSGPESVGVNYGLKIVNPEGGVE